MVVFRPSFARKEGQWILSLRQFGNVSNPLEDSPCQAARSSTSGYTSVASLSSRESRSLGVPALLWRS